MRKIPGLFVYDPATLARGSRIKGSGARYLDQITPGCEWVTAGEGVATEKIDGSACLVYKGKLYKRYDAKHGKTPPPDFRPAQESPDSVTGHWPGWLPVTRDDNSSKWHLLTLESVEYPERMPDGTYEIIGPHFQGNPYALNEDILVKHGSPLTMSVEIDLAISRTFTSIRAFLLYASIEGIVFHHPDGRMAKVTRAGFGIAWP
jgi:Family of unknown function (DUF5565)